MHFILATVGSSGDVHPFVGIGRALTRRGHRVTLMTSGHFEPLARQAGLEFVDPAPEWDFRSSLDDVNLWHKFRGPRFVMDLVAKTLPSAFAAVAQYATAGETVLVASSLAIGARVAQEVLELPLATVHLSPSIFRTCYGTVKMPGMLLDDWVPQSIKRAQFWLADALVIDRKLGRPINQFRAQYGLAPVRSIMGHWWHSPQLVLGLFPEWFAAPQPDWPPQTVLTGFPLYDEGDLIEPSSDLLDFLASGTPPIVFTPGSANVHARAFFETACTACEQLDRRGLLLTRFPEQLPPRLPAQVRHFDFVPFGWLLPRSAAVVHHGGIGSLAQGFAGGIPQIVMPMGFDQFDNAWRLEKLRCGKSILPKYFRPSRVISVLAELLESQQVAIACAQAAERIREMHPMNSIIEHLERLGRMDPTLTGRK